MNLNIRLNLPLFGLPMVVEIEGRYEHETFEPDSVWIQHIGSAYVYAYLPDASDVSDFYSAHGTAIDEAVRAELADHAEAAADTYEAQRQDEIDDAAERARS